jgi:hypothetical protein
MRDVKYRLIYILSSLEKIEENTILVFLYGNIVILIVFWIIFRSEGRIVLETTK